MKKLVIVLAVFLGLALTLGPTLAATGLPNSKAAVQVKDKQIFGYTTSQAWNSILKQTIKTSNAKDILANVSLVCGLYTFTKVRSLSGIGETKFAKANIKVRARLQNVAGGDPIYLEPNGGQGNSSNGIVFSERLQELSATFAGYFNDSSVLTPEEVSLLLETLDAHSFNFVAVDVPQGTYNLEVQATISTTQSNLDTTITSAKALINEGAVTIEEVRMIKNPVEPYVIE